MSHEIVPDGVDAAELRRRQNADCRRDKECERCRHCGYAKLYVRVGEDREGKYYCESCNTHIDDPVVADSVTAALEVTQ